MISEEKRSHFAEALGLHMKAKGWDRNQLASKIGRTPEHVRKLERGLPPGPDLEEKLIRVFELNTQETKEFTNAIRWDRWMAKYKEPPPQSPPAPAISKYWDDLTAEQQQTLICVADCLSRSRSGR